MIYTHPCAAARVVPEVMHTAVIALLLVTLAGPANAARFGTPHISLIRNLDVPASDGGLGARPELADTTLLASWTFGSAPSCSDEGWTPVDLTAGEGDFGSFAGVLDGRDEYSTERCIDDLSCLWGFVAGSNDTYACGGRPQQAVVPYGSAERGHIWNEIQSPPINLMGNGSAFLLRFAVYRALRFRDLVFYTWRVRSLRAGVPGAWRSNDALYYGATVDKGDWYFQQESIGALIEPGADQIQIALGVIDMAGEWAGIMGDGGCHSNAPLFDTVKVYRVAVGGPQWSVDFADLFQDNFSQDGTTTGTVRMDMARDINPRNAPSIVPGDSVVVCVNEPTVGLAFDGAGVPASGPAVYLHVRNVSAEKSGWAISGNPARWPVVDTGGGWTTLRFDSVRTASGPVADHFCVDLNDALYTPGDIVEFYFSARDAAGRISEWSEFLGTVVGGAGSKAMEATCLPRAHDGLGILYVDDTDGRSAQPYFDAVFLGNSEVDRYDVRSPDAMVGNGPGSRVRNVRAQLSNVYDSMIWSSGTLTAGLIGDGGGPEKSPDAAMLVEYLKTKVPRGVLYLNGDQIAAELKRLNSPSVHDLLQFIQYDLVADSHSQYTNISPVATNAPGSTFTFNGQPDTFFLYGGCAELNSFCLLAPTGSAVMEMQYGGLQYGAEVSQSSPANASSAPWVLLSGFGFEFIRDDRPGPYGDRDQHMADILASRDFSGLCDWAGSIQPDETGAEVAWNIGCGDTRQIRVMRRQDSEIDGTLIHTAEVPPWTGLIHDDIAVGHRSDYWIVAQLARGRQAVIDSASVFRSAVVTGFRAEARDLGIEVSWSIADKTGIEALTVEKRRGGEDNFAPAGPDSLHLSPNETKFFDRSFEPGVDYEYRLVMDYFLGWQAAGPLAGVQAPRALSLGQNAPNPFNPSTRIPFLIPSAGRVEVVIFDVNGARVRTLLNDQRKAGYSEVHWDGRNDGGSPVSSGVYFCRLNAAGQSLTRKIVLVR